MKTPANSPRATTPSGSVTRASEWSQPSFASRWTGGASTWTDARRAVLISRSAVGCGLIVAGLAGLRVAVDGLHAPVPRVLFACAVSMLLVPLVLKTALGARAGLLVPAIGLVGTAAMAHAEGALHSEATYFMVVVPLAASFLSGRVAAVAFGVAVQLAIMAVAWSGEAFPVRDVPPMHPEVLYMAGLCGAAAFSTLLGWTYETERLRLDQDRQVTIALMNRVQADMARALDSAESANRAKSTFLAQMSHELRTPLTAVVGFSKLVADRGADVLDATSQDYLSRINANGLALMGVIQDVLDLSKIEAGRPDLELEWVSVGDVVRDVCGSVELDAAARATELVTRVPEPLAKVRADPLRLRQILLNLVGNAVKFTQGGQVEVEVVAIDPGQASRIEVRDTGIGIPRDKLALVFAPFVQQDEGTGRKYGGSGLGLAISAALCHAMGWELTLDSTLGEGTVAAIHLNGAPEANSEVG